MASMGNPAEEVAVCEKPVPLLVPLDKAAERIGIPAKTLWRWVSGKKVPAVRMGGKWYLRTEEVERIAAEGVPAPGGSDLEAASLAVTEGQPLPPKPEDD